MGNVRDLNSAGLQEHRHHMGATFFVVVLVSFRSDCVCMGVFFVCLFVLFCMCAHACMYLCMCVCMYACVNGSVCMDAHGWMNVCVRMYICMYICMYVYMYVCMYICMYVYMYVCIYVCMYVNMYVCMYVRVMSRQRDMLERLMRMQNLPSLPRVQLSDPESMFASLESVTPSLSSWLGY